MLQVPNLKELSFLVYGLGLSGHSTVKFLKKNKVKNFEVWDDKNKIEYKNLRSKNLKKTLNFVDYIILSPGVSLLRKRNLRRFEHKIITDIDLFYLAKNKPKSIMVTGTNGKSTTSKLIAHLLQKNNFKISIGGNIGTPVLNLKSLKKNYVIIEASSFQLSHSKFICPDIAFFLNLTKDHLDWHGSMSNYLLSKLKIFQNQKKNHYAIINKKFKKIFQKEKFKSKLIIPKEKEYKKIKLKIKNNFLISKINNENMSFVFALSKLLKIEEKSFLNSMKSFKGLPHRFEVFLKKNEVTFINDSKATSFKATQPALSSLKNIYWILGGLPKKGDKIDLTNLKKNINKCYLIGKNVNFFRSQIKGKLVFSVTKNLKNSIIQILKDVNLKKSSKGNVLLSPASASFDQFSNFENRGEEFKRLCKKYVKRLN